MTELIPDDDKNVFESESPDIHAKKCLGYAVVSIIITGLGFGILGIDILLAYWTGGYSTSLWSTWVIATVIYLIALAFSYLSRKNSKAAREEETQNNMEKVGRILYIASFILIIIFLVINIGYLFLPA